MIIVLTYVIRRLIFKLCTTHLIDSYYIKIIIFYAIPEYPIGIRIQTLLKKR